MERQTKNTQPKETPVLLTVFGIFVAIGGGILAAVSLFFLLFTKGTYYMSEMPAIFLPLLFLGIAQIAGAVILLIGRKKIKFLFFGFVLILLIVTIPVRVIVFDADGNVNEIRYQALSYRFSYVYQDRVTKFSPEYNYTVSMHVIGIPVYKKEKTAKNPDKLFHDGVGFKIYSDKQSTKKPVIDITQNYPGLYDGPMYKAGTNEISQIKKNTGLLLEVDYNNNGQNDSNNDYWVRDSYEVSYDGTITKKIIYNISGETYNESKRLSDKDYKNLYELAMTIQTNEQVPLGYYGGADAPSWSVYLYDENGVRTLLYYTDVLLEDYNIIPEIVIGYFD